jgi:hypothetical protein
MEIIYSRIANTLLNEKVLIFKHFYFLDRFKMVKRNDDEDSQLHIHCCRLKSNTWMGANSTKESCKLLDPNDRSGPDRRD